MPTPVPTMFGITARIEEFECDPGIPWDIVSYDFLLDTQEEALLRTLANMFGDIC